MSSTFQMSNGDVIISAVNGRPVLVSDAPKLRQDISEFFTINVLPNGFGAGLEQLIGMVEISPEIFVSLADKQVRDGLFIFIGLQSDLRITRSTDEKLLGLSYLAIERDPTDPTRFFFRANFVTEKGNQLPLTQVLVT